MLKVNLEALEKMTNQGEQDEPDRRVTGNFALYSAAGTKSGSVVYFELEPGCELGTHTDSAEEIVYIEFKYSLGLFSCGHGLCYCNYRSLFSS
jgi:hypothetical protein